MALKPFTRDAWIDAKPAAVFAVLADLDQADQWHPILRIKRLTEGPLEVGSGWVEVRADAKGKPSASTVRVTAMEPGLFALHVDHKAVDLDCTFRLIPVESGTRVEYECTGKGKGLARFFGGAIAKEIERVDGDILDRLAAQMARPSRPKTKGREAAKPKAKGGKAKKSR
ncbi:MAG: SRPBCC family protein [Candidatus Thermoplasmatota archaeon]